MRLAIGPDRDLLVEVAVAGDSTRRMMHVDGLICGFDPQARRFHAVQADHALEVMRQGRRRTVDGVCGRRVRVWVMPATSEVGSTALWPPRVANLRDDASRCEVCHDATGRRRPSGYFPPLNAEVA